MLDALAAHGVCSLAELERYTGLGKTSLFRMMHTMELNGLVEKDQFSRYRLGLKLLELSGALIAERSFIEVAEPHLVRASRELNVSAHLSELRDGQAVATYVVNPPSQLRLAGPVGVNLPAYVTAFGQVLLAWMPLEELEATAQGFDYASSPRTPITSYSELDELLLKVRLEGVAVECDGTEAGYATVAAPVFDYRGACIASAGVVGLTREVQADPAPFVQRVKVLASSISADLGAARR